MRLSSATERANAGGSLQILTLGLGSEIFAVETERVHEVLDLPSITRIPNCRPFIKGLIDVRGKVITVTDLHVKFGMVPTAPTADTRIVVIEVQIEGEPTLVGTLADRVYEVTELPIDSMEDAPRIGMRWRPEFIRAIGKRNGDFIIVADIDQVFASEESAWHATHQDAAA
ncbi:MAG: purine-binding chemotaxis protein CheW [Pseudomonadota bacterium]|nr:purine-binding chemotaxis protein CheW [Pseudomonadota bacterium]